MTAFLERTSGVPHNMNEAHDFMYFVACVNDIPFDRFHLPPCVLSVQPAAIHGKRTSSKIISSGKVTRRGRPLGKRAGEMSQDKLRKRQTKQLPYFQQFRCAPQHKTAAQWPSVQMQSSPVKSDPENSFAAPSPCNDDAAQQNMQQRSGTTSTQKSTRRAVGEASWSIITQEDFERKRTQRSAKTKSITWTPTGNDINR